MFLAFLVWIEGLRVKSGLNSVPTFGYGRSLLAADRGLVSRGLPTQDLHFLHGFGLLQTLSAGRQQKRCPCSAM